MSFVYSAIVTLNYNFERSGGGLFAFSLPPFGLSRLLHALFPLCSLFVKLNLVGLYVQYPDFVNCFPFVKHLVFNHYAWGVLTIQDSGDDAEPGLRAFDDHLFFAVFRRLCGDLPAEHSADGDCRQHEPFYCAFIHKFRQTLLSFKRCVFAGSVPLLSKLFA